MYVNLLIFPRQIEVFILFPFTLDFYFFLHDVLCLSALSNIKVLTILSKPQAGEQGKNQMVPQPPLYSSKGVSQLFLEFCSFPKACRKCQNQTFPSKFTIFYTFTMHYPVYFWRILKSALIDVM